MRQCAVKKMLTCGEIEIKKTMRAEIVEETVEGEVGSALSFL